jgi:hypothetical protein
MTRDSSLLHEPLPGVLVEIQTSNVEGLIDGRQNWNPMGRHLMMWTRRIVQAEDGRRPMMRRKRYWVGCRAPLRRNLREIPRRRLRLEGRQLRATGRRLGIEDDGFPGQARPK